MRCQRPVNPPRVCCGGFTLIETLVVVLILGVIAAIATVSLSGSRRSVRSGLCLSNLRQINSAFRQYAISNKHLLPDPAVSGISWPRAVQPYLSGQLSLNCPADTEVFPLTGISYDWRDTGEASTTMAGRAIDQGARTTAVLNFESLPGWHAARKINVARIDGSASTMDETACFKDLATPVRTIVAPSP